MFVIGTAGHVDHGKSALVRALSGIDPDRLQEEKDRGMTIDLGFAWLRLPGGTEVSIVDVPGHERFIKNMLAGVGGIDMAMLVIAADEGVMPQTREHLAILDLLGVSRGLLVVTKMDLVDGDWLDLMSAEVEDVVKGTSLEGSPLVRCSASTGEGLPGLVAAIEEVLARTAPKRDLGRPRLPIDRVFTVAGFGTVVTGTLVDGLIGLGEEVEVVPARTGGHLTTLRTRIRGLQTHRSRVEIALPGTRTAANLAGIEPDQLWRGQVLTRPGWLQPSEAVDVRLRTLPSIGRPLRHNLNVTFHSLASEAPARIRLLEADQVRPGEEAWAQIRLFEPLALLSGDRFIIRNSNDTLGGGIIVATQARRHTRRSESVIGGLERQRGGSPAEALYAAIAASEPVALKQALARTDLSPAMASGAVERLSAEGRIVLLGEAEGALAYTSSGFERLRQAAASAMGTYLQEHPLRRGLAKEELRSRIALPARTFGLVMEYWLKRDEVVDGGIYVAPSDWAPRLTEAQQEAVEAYLALLRSPAFSPPTDQRPSGELVTYLAESGAVVEVRDGVVFERSAFDEMTRIVVAELQARESLTMAQVRDLLGSSRRYVQPFLEELDSRRITMRRGDERLLRRPSAEGPALLR